MTPAAKHALGSAVISAAITAGILAAQTRWPQLPLGAAPARFAVLDVSELYRLKEQQVAARLAKSAGQDSERQSILREARQFGTAIAQVMETLPAECHCLVLLRAALVGSPAALTDLTPVARQRLGL